MLWMPSQAQITIENHGYKGVLVALSDDVDEDPRLIQGIKEAFTQASEFLYQITGQVWFVCMSARNTTN